MKLRWTLKIAAMVVLGAVAIVLYADLQSIHQIYRITPAMINRAPDDTTRQALEADREKRNAEERRLKLKVGAGLAGDLAVLALVAIWSMRSPGNADRPRNPSATIVIG
jgi:hypothetical protein